MLIKDVMTADCKVVNEFSYLDQVFNLIVEKDIHHLPVVNDDGKLVGIISDRDLLNAADHSDEVPVFPRITVGDIMVKDVVTLTAETTVKEAAKVIDEKEFHSLPVVEADNKLVGIVTIRDLLRAVVSMN